jgi:chromosome segregation ATPase
MMDLSMTIETVEVPETAKFLRRFADLMSNGQNATYLQHAAVLLETLTARVTAAIDEEQLWRYKYEAVIHHADRLEAECDALKHDIDGHVNITSSILTERDALRATLKAHEAELLQLRGALNHERDELAKKSAAHEEALVEVRAAFDCEREGLEASIVKSAEELAELRLASEREREQLMTTVEEGKQSLAELRLILGRERDEFQSILNAHESELAAFRVVSRRECDELKAKVAGLEARRAELRSTFERINNLRNRTIEHQGNTDHSFVEKLELEAEGNPFLAQPDGADPSASDKIAVVPRTTLLQARAQFEYLAKECVLRGDIASQVMCELGAHTMDLALTAVKKTGDLPVGEVAISILVTPGSTASVIADTM